MAEAIFFGLIWLLVPVALIGAVVYGVMAVTRRGREFAAVDPGIGTVRRLYFYVVSFVALMMATVGVVQIGQYLLDSLFGGDVLSPSKVRLAVGLSLTIVGLPLWGVHWRIIGRYIRDLPVETRSVVRKVYLYISLAASTGVAVGAAVSILRWILGNESFSGYPWAAIVVWGTVWAFHWRLEAREGQPTPETRAVRRLYVYSVAAGMLVVAALGVGQLVHIILREAYAGLTSVTLLARSGLWAEPTRDAVSLALVAGPVWAAHWLYFARRDFESVLRQLYLYALSIFGGISTLLAALGITLYGVLVWSIGVPEHESAAAHFRFFPGALASLIVAGGILAYHGSVAKAEARLPGPEPLGGQVSYPYALAALGLGTLAGGIVTLVSTAIGMLVESGRTALVGEDVWRNMLALSITLGVLGAPMWGYYWSIIQRRVNAGGPEERRGLPRRIFIFAVLGVGMLVLLGSLSHLIFVFLNELLGGDLSKVLRDTKVSIAIVVAAAIFLPYYWMVYRTDRREAPALVEEERHRKRKAVTVLAREGEAGFLRQLEAVLGYGVSSLQSADPDAGLPELSDDEYLDLAERINDVAGPNVLLVADGATVRLLSYL